MTEATPLLVLASVTAGFAGTWWWGGSTDLLDWATPARVVAAGYLILLGIGAVALSITGEMVGGALLIGCAMLAIAIGTASTTLIRGGRPGPPERTMRIGPWRRWVVIGAAAIGILAATSLALEHGMPLLSDDPQAARMGWTGPRLDAFRWLVPPAALLAFGIALVRRDRRSAAIAGAALVGVAGIEVLAASRALPLELGLAAVLMAVWAGGRIGARRWALILLAGGVVFIGVLFARVGDDGAFASPVDAVRFAIERTVGRVVLIGPRTIEVIVEVFPDEQPYLGGSTYTRWLDRLTGTPPAPSLGSFLFERLFPGEPPGGFASPGVLGEGYANFGPVGALLLMVGLGAVSVGVGEALRRTPAEVVVRVMFALLAVVLVRTYAASLLGSLLAAGAAVAWWLAIAGRRAPET